MQAHLDKFMTTFVAIKDAYAYEYAKIPNGYAFS